MGVAKPQIPSQKGQSWIWYSGLTHFPPRSFPICCVTLGKSYTFSGLQSSFPQLTVEPLRRGDDNTTHTALTYFPGPGVPQARGPVQTPVMIDVGPSAHIPLTLYLWAPT